MFTIQKILDFSENDEIQLDFILGMPYNTKKLNLILILMKN